MKKTDHSGLLSVWHLVLKEIKLRILNIKDFSDINPLLYFAQQHACN